jgi:hypothetical protein
MPSLLVFPPLSPLARIAEAGPTLVVFLRSFG